MSTRLTDILLIGANIDFWIIKEVLMETSVLFWQVLDEIGVDVASQVQISCY